MIMKCFVCYDIVNSKYKSNTFQKSNVHKILKMQMHQLHIRRIMLIFVIEINRVIIV